MNYKGLIEKYWAGETTLEEEKVLKAYFEKEEIEEELVTFAPMFHYWKDAKKTTFQQPLDNILIHSNAKVKPLKVVNRVYQIRKIAAAILVLIMIGFGYQKIQTPSKGERIATYWANKEIKDPQEAFLKTKAALLLVSKKLNSGTEAAFQQVTKVQQVGQFIKSPD